MKFKVLDRFESPAYNAKSRAYLVWDNWNDYSFYTLFGLLYVDENSVKHDIGSLKIGFFGQKELQKRLKIGDTFDALDPDHFSLGQSDSYYLNLNNLGSEVRDEILTALKDVAKFPELYDRAIDESVTKVSLLRSISPTSVTGQFRRLAMGLARLTSYSFQFLSPRIKSRNTRMSLSFDVLPASSPPTNIHVIIGRNGVGKTFLINNMINSLIGEEPDNHRKYGEFISEATENAPLFANLISVSFSAFDESEPKPERKDKTAGIQYSYIGLKRIQTSSDKNLGPKSTTMLRNEFFKSLDRCKTIKKIERWKRVIEMLEADPMFEEAEVKKLVDIEEEEEFKSTSSDTFKRLSSGHKIVLLTITRLVETLQEKSLVLIDEPEAHLHPPLLSAFIRSLSEILSETNGVAIIATHSPVILQEVPKSCVWKLRRSGVEAIGERLQIESFGENVGVLTNEVFGLEITRTGFYKMIHDASEEYENYRRTVSFFNDQLGMEARAIIMSLTNNQSDL